MANASVLLFFAGLEHTGHHFWNQVVHQCPTCKDATRVRHALAALWQIMGPDQSCGSADHARCDALGCTWRGASEAPACARGRGSYARVFAEVKRLSLVTRESVFLLNVHDLSGTGMMSYPNGPFWRTPTLGDIRAAAAAMHVRLRVAVLLRDHWDMLKGFLYWAERDREYIGAWAYSTGRNHTPKWADAWWVQGRTDTRDHPKHYKHLHLTPAQAEPLLLSAFAAAARELAEQLLRLPRHEYVCIEYQEATTGGRLLDESLRGVGASTHFESISRALWKPNSKLLGAGLARFQAKLRSNAPQALAEMLMAVRAVRERCKRTA